MANPFLTAPIRSGARATTNPFLQGAGRDDLRGRATELEQLQQQLGAPEIEEEKPGVFSRIIDVLSRPNYAIAGFAEEVFGDQPSVSQGVTRALAEIFSGVGGIQGEKKAFGEVLENLGVGTTTLADAFPALEGTWVGHFGSRGAAGLALDIFTDPLTYMTFGASAGAKGVVAVGKGKRFLNAAGAAKHKQLMDEAIRAIPEKQLKDPFGKNTAYRKAKIDADKQFEKLYTVGDDIDPALLMEGGAKLKVPFSETYLKLPGTDRLSEPIKYGLSLLPEKTSEAIAKGANETMGAMRRTVAAVFSQNGPLANLPEPIRSRAIALTDSFHDATVAHRSHLMSQIDDIEKQYRKWEKIDPEIGERWHHIREGTGDPAKRVFKHEGEEEAFNRTMALYDSMGETAVRHGAIDQATFDAMAPTYIHHVFKNPEAFDMYKARPGYRPEGKGTARHLKERKFATLEDAVNWSKSEHDDAVKLLGRGEADRVVPVLEADYDVMKNLRTYTNAHAESIARKAWREEMVEQFGMEWSNLVKVSDEDALFEAAQKGIIPEGTMDIKDVTPENLPKVQAIKAGQIEDSLVDLFGREGAQYQLYNSKLTDNTDVLLPKAIGDVLEKVNASVFNAPKEVKGLLKGFDWLNNQFKWGTYTLWPASLSRDAYSNLFLSGLRIGLGALNPARHKAAIKILAGRNLDEVYLNTGYTLRQLKEMGDAFGVNVPGVVFTEQVGKVNLGKVQKALTDKRSLVENEARLVLWLDEIANGVDPRTAADTVGEFLFNYGRVSSVERDLFRRLIPFYTFTRKNVELQAKMLKSNPGRVINQVKPFRKRDSENDMMMKWEREGLGIRLDRDGKTVHALQGIDLPLRNLDTLWAGGFGPTGRRIMGMVTPMLKTPLEAMTGRDFFTGGDMKRAYGPTLGRLLDSSATPQGMKDWLGFKKEVDEAGRATYTFDGVRYSMLVKSWAFSRVMSTSDRQFREYLGPDEQNTAAALLDFLTGIRYKDLNIDEQQERLLKRRIRELENSLVRRGAMRTYTRGYQPKDDGRTSL